MFGVFADWPKNTKCIPANISLHVYSYLILDFINPVLILYKLQHRIAKFSPGENFTFFVTWLNFLSCVDYVEPMATFTTWAKI